jgi:hypothetical protein
MKWLTPTGRPKDIKGIHEYRVDWDGEQGSEYSATILDLLYPYWKYDVVYAELPVVGTNRLRYDYVNVSKRIICECDGKQHDQFSKHFHGDCREKYKKQIKNDLLKDSAASRNGYTMVRVKPSDLPALEADIKKWFFETYNITL